MYAARGVGHPDCTAAAGCLRISASSGRTCHCGGAVAVQTPGGMLNTAEKQPPAPVLGMRTPQISLNPSRRVPEITMTMQKPPQNKIDH